MGRMLREESQLSQTPPLPSSPYRGGIAARGAFVFASALMTLVTWQPATAAVCHVPTALLCQGCVERLSIRVTRDGACKVSFPSPSAPESAEAGTFVDIHVEAETPRSVHRRVRAPYLSDAKPAAPLRTPAGCFVFNGRRFCE
jgi:hypothetical protein